MKAFKAYDIRGIYNEDFNSNDVYKIGFFLPKLLNTTKILVGRDARESSPEIFKALCDGITDSGASVLDAGLTTTPMIYWATAKYAFDGSVMITASHNPKEYNGMKISGKDALPVGFDSGLSDLKDMVETMPINITETKGNVKQFDFREDYLDFQNSYLTDISNLNLSIDLSNGMAALLIKDILGDAPHYIFDDIDCTFPNHEANPLVPENVVDIKKAVLKNKSDLGIVFDGDADRVMFIDEKGEFISPDLIIALLGHYFLEGKNTSERVIQDIRSSKAVGEYLSQFGAEMHTWRVGRAYAALKLREIDGLFGGELAGHYYFKDFYYSDSGILAMLIVLKVIKEKKDDGITVSELISKISGYANSGEINFTLEKKLEAMEAVVKHFSDKQRPEKMMDFDGYRLEYKDFWFSIRPSNTEPYLRFLAEAKNSVLLNEIVAEARSIIASYIK